MVRLRAARHATSGKLYAAWSIDGWDRPASRLPPWLWLRQLRRHRLGAGVLRHGRERGAGVRTDGSRVRRRHQLLRHRQRVWRRPQRELHRTMAEGKGVGGAPAAAPQLEGVQPGWARAERPRPVATAHPPAGRREPDAAADRSARHVPDPRARSRHAARRDARARSTTWFAWARCSTSAPATSKRGGSRVGCGSATSAACARFEWVQNSFSLLDRAAEREMFPLCADQRCRVHGVQPARRRMAHRQVPCGRRYPDGSRMTLRPEPYRHLERDGCFGAWPRSTRRRAPAVSR